MSIEYVIDKQCRLKEDKDLAVISRMVKIKSILDSVDRTTFLPVSKTKRFLIDSPTDTGSKVESMTVARMREYILPLIRNKHYCINCPVNIFKREYGCYGKIEFPIEKEVEELLCETVKLSIENHWEEPAGYYIEDLCCKNLQVDNIVKMRSCFFQPAGLNRIYPKYFQLSEGIETAWGGKWIFCKNFLSTDEIFQICLFSGTLGQEPLVMQAGFFALFYDVAEIEIKDLERKNKVKANRLYKAVYEFQDLAAAMTKAAKSNHTFTVKCTC